MCYGVHMIVTNRETLRPVRVGLEIAAALEALHGEAFDLWSASRLFGSNETLRRVESGGDPAAIAASWAGDERAWRARREPYLLYPQ